MIAVWYDPDCDQIWIADEDRSYASRSLVAYIDSSTGKLGIRLKTSTTDTVMTDYRNLTDKAGLGFLSAIEAKAYLDGEFTKQRALDASSVTATANVDILAGMPVCVSRQNGGLLPARADTYASAFVIGLLPETTLSGFPGSPTRDALTLTDWSVITGTTLLNVGQPYFLGVQGGLTTTPDRTPGLCLVRVGNATGPKTIAPVQCDPILL